MSLETLIVVDDDPDALDSLVGLLSKDFRVIGLSDSRQVLETAKREHPSAMLIDLQMPDPDGLAICRMVRAEASLKDTVLIVVSGMNESSKRTECFLWGADDFIAKPFSSSEIVARLRGKLRWSRTAKTNEHDQRLYCGNLVVDESGREVIVGTDRVDLTSFEFKLLKYFLENAGKMVSREKLLEEVWESAKVSARTIDTHVYTLRQKLKDFNWEWHTIYGIGYVLRSKDS